MCYNIIPEYFRCKLVWYIKNVKVHIQEGLVEQVMVNSVIQYYSHSSVRNKKCILYRAVKNNALMIMIKLQD